jgi:signal transduction histidine kinase
MSVPGKGWSKLALPGAVTMTALSAGLFAAWVVLVLTMPAKVPVDDVSGQLFFAVPIVGGGAIAFLLTTRKPGNPVGWLLSASMVVLPLLFVGTDYGDHWLYVPDLPGALVVPLEALSNFGWAAGFPMLLVLVPLLFPDGHLLSRRWRPLIWLTAAVAVVGVVATILDPGAYGDGHRHLANPLGLPGAHDVLSFLSGAVWSTVVVALMVTGVVSLVIRYRRSGPDLRQQLKWFIGAVALGAAGLVVALVTAFGQAGIIAVTIGFTALPVSIGIGVLKYRLYDIDLVINRTVLFAAMAVFITAVYIAIVVGIGSLVGGTGKANLFLSVLATAIVGVAFQPVFSRARRFANRLVYGKRATPYEVLSGLSDHLVDTYSSGDLLPRMARILAEATGATKVEVQLRVASELRSATVWPSDSPPSPPTPLTGQVLPPMAGVDHAVAVRHQGELLGALILTKRAGESLSPIEQKLVADLAGQAGLMLKNAGLTADLQARLEDLRASRQRLVTAQDAERRRIERNLHDGAQQHLVAIKVKLGLLESLARKDPDRVVELASEVKRDADEALETLRDLARGIYPPLLADQGLVAALESQARKAPLPVEVTADGVSRYPQELEAAVYFCCLEALQNVTKYAGASQASVRLSAPNGSLDFEVLDDGAGFDVATTPKGSGLTNMTDRIDALGGNLQLTSTPGEGTRITGSLPIGLAGTPALRAAP